MDKHFAIEFNEKDEMNTLLNNLEFHIQNIKFNTKKCKKIIYLYIEFDKKSFVC